MGQTRSSNMRCRVNASLRASTCRCESTPSTNDSLCASGTVLPARTKLDGQQGPASDRTVTAAGLVVVVAVVSERS